MILVLTTKKNLQELTQKKTIFARTDMICKPYQNWKRLNLNLTTFVSMCKEKLHL
jgi:hypothetical protein